MELMSPQQRQSDSNAEQDLDQTESSPAAQRVITNFAMISENATPGILRQLGIPGSAEAVQLEQESDPTSGKHNILEPDTSASKGSSVIPEQGGIRSPAQDFPIANGAGTGDPVVHSEKTAGLATINSHDDDGWDDAIHDDFLAPSVESSRTIALDGNGATTNKTQSQEPVAVESTLESILEDSSAALVTSEFMHESNSMQDAEILPSNDNESSFFDEPFAQTKTEYGWDVAADSDQALDESEATLLFGGSLNGNAPADQEVIDATYATEHAELESKHDLFGDENDAAVDWMADEQHVNEVEDSWAKALGDADDNVDSSWAAAFDDDLDDEGFLEDIPEQTVPQSVPATQRMSYTPEGNAMASHHEPSATRQASVSSSYGVVQPPRPLVHTQQPAAPMQFFEELPMTQPQKARRPKQPVVSNAPSPGPPPSGATQSQPQQPPHSRSTSQNQYSQFRPPERLDPFPPQPPQSQQPSASQTTNVRYSPAPAQPAAPPSTRYSPAPAQPIVQPTSTAGAPLPVPNSRYSPAVPPQSQPPVIPASTSLYATPPATVNRSVSAAVPPPPAPTASFQPPPRPTGPGDNRTAVADRYSPSPAAANPALPPNPFAPRTSSPLARSEHRPQGNRTVTAPVPSQYDELDTLMQIPSRAPAAPASVPPESGPRPPSGHMPSAAFNQPLNHNMAVPARPQQYSPPTSRMTRQGENLPRSPGKSTASSQYAPQDLSQLTPPGRAQSSSPSHSRRPPVQRTVPFQDQAPGVMPLGYPPTPEPDNDNFVLPEDETAQDPLRRFKGHPIFHWGPGGIAVTSFPKIAPRYGGGQSAPSLKSFPGEVKLAKIKEACAVDEIFTSFPGPLKSRNKKKEVIAWLSRKIDALQLELQDRPIDAPNDPAGHSRAEEKIMLWELVRLMVEHDRTLSGTPAVDSAVKWILSPNLQAIANQKLNDARAAGTVVGNSSSTAPDGIDAGVVEAVRNNLLRGEREQAIWQAVDNRLWAHAFLISSTMPSNVWKQVVQEFVRKEVRSAGADNQSLAALYQVFAGNWDESMDELVPASARAGLQMMSTSEAHEQGQNMLEGLNRWRETLGLMLSNRSSEDEKAMVALGKLLAGYNRVEAAHACFLFATTLGTCGGADDSNANFTLLGADPARVPEQSQDLDAILLTEVYEWALSLAPSASTVNMPHLQAYKLHHAYVLAESGQRAEAIQYCDAIGAAMKATTRSSPYYHSTLISQLNELTQRLSQSPKDPSSSWIAKPFTSGSMWAKFNSFVAGDDDAASTGSGSQMENEAGPFAHLQGGSSNVSRTESSGDLYGAALGGAPPPIAMNSRYAPSPLSGKPYESQHHIYQGSPYQPATFGSYESQPSFGTSSPSFGSPPSSSYMQRQHSNLSQPQTYSPQVPHGFDSQQPVPNEPYIPNIAGGQPRGFEPMNPSLETDESFGESSEPTNTNELETPVVEQKINGFGPTVNGYAPYSDGYEPSSGGYAPPADLSYQPYEPPTGSSYQPYEPSSPVEDEPSESRPKKKSIMDDEDDEFSKSTREAAKQQQASRSREPDDAVRKAAEADAARDKAAAAEKRGSWFGGWFGKKDPNAPTVYKAKLGEENSFYFDPETKKWVNKKGGATTPTASAATPPPPKGPPSAPPSRNVSGTSLSGPPRMQPASRSPAPPMLSEVATPDSGPPSRLGTPARVDSPAVNGEPDAAPLAPPSRPATSASNASSIDDLIGNPGARKGGTIKKGKKAARYVDVMGQ